jgi:hypothetical protein
MKIVPLPCIMPPLVLVGLVAPEVLAAFQSLPQPFAEGAGVYWAFVLRQDQEIPVGATFSATGRGSEGPLVSNRYRLLTVSQQYGASWEVIPPGWNTICAFQFLGPGSCLLARLPMVSDWYGQPATELVLTAEGGTGTTRSPMAPVG